MASFASRGLIRRLAALDRATRDKVRHRQDLREKARAEAAILAALDCLRDAGTPLDPDAGCLWQWRGSAHRLAEFDTPELRRADAAFIAADPELAAWEAREAARLAEWAARYTQGGPPPQPGSASPFAWYAWSVAQGQSGAAPESPTGGGVV